MAATARIWEDDRTDHRDDVHFRARAIGPDGRAAQLLIVNISARGLMARCETALAVGDTLRVHLPVIGQIAAEIRWSLGGRVGLQLDRIIPLSEYYAVLAVMAKS